jgi:hypothetical protein
MSCEVFGLCDRRLTDGMQGEADKRQPTYTFDRILCLRLRGHPFTERLTARYN